MTGNQVRAGRSALASGLRNLWTNPATLPELEAFLVANSRLPGPRANLQLAATFADIAGVTGTDEAQWRVLTSWLELTAAHAPTGDPREFLPFCAVQALGALLGDADAARRNEINTRLRAAANDERWRTREAVAIALQRIAEQRIVAARQIIEAWLPAATMLEQRAIVAALAHPPILRDLATARYALDVTDQILGHVPALDCGVRKSGEFRVLRQALSYAISVLVAALPEEGFLRLTRWARTDDPDIKSIVRANLGKARLTKRYPAQVREVMEIP